MTSALAARARSQYPRILLAFPARSPTTQLIWAIAILTMLAIRQVYHRRTSPRAQDGSIDSIIGNRGDHLGPGRLKEDMPSVRAIDTLRAVEPRAWNALAAGHPLLGDVILASQHGHG